MSKLNVGDIIEVKGFVMLETLDEGFYRVKSITKYHGKDTYSFATKRGKKTICRHYVDSVDLWVKPADHCDFNKIVKVDK